MRGLVPPVKDLELGAAAAAWAPGPCVAEASTSLNREQMIFVVVVDLFARPTKSGVVLDVADDLVRVEQRPRRVCFTFPSLCSSSCGRRCVRSRLCLFFRSRKLRKSHQSALLLRATSWPRHRHAWAPPRATRPADKASGERQRPSLLEHEHRLIRLTSVLFLLLTTAKRSAGKHLERQRTPRAAEPIAKETTRRRLHHVQRTAFDVARPGRVLGCWLRFRRRRSSECGRGCLVPLLLITSS
mmetsp:Transcript_7525/g.18132  ORF Transcript_7525/g.18132 Transcript_7525/m.18132 type:complete len:242 (+) Transcript_7525:1170-1895(+)